MQIVINGKVLNWKQIIMALGFGVGAFTVGAELPSYSPVNLFPDTEECE